MKSASPEQADFGIAKATGQRLTDKTLFTQFHAFKAADVLSALAHLRERSAPGRWPR